MHGRKRVGVPPPTIEEKAASKKKVDIYKRLNGVSFKHRASRTVSREALELISQLLSANPDVYTLWNYAREQILVFSGEVIHESVSAMNDEEFTALIKTQLGVAAAAIKRNSKSYPAWYHRKWLVGKYHAGRAELGPIVQLREELALCSQMLTADERNFHCWNYRRWVASLTAEVEVSKSGLTGAESGNLDLQASEVHKDDIMQSELRFTDEKIEQNFSNYSAWHSRTHLLQRKLVDLSLKGRIALVSTGEPPTLFHQNNFRYILPHSHTHTRARTHTSALPSISQPFQSWGLFIKLYLRSLMIRVHGFIGGG